MRLKLRTGESTGKVAMNNANATDKGVEWSYDELRLPVQHRYMSPVVIEFRSRGVWNKAEAHAVVWLPTVIENETLEFKLLIYKSDNARRLTQNFIMELAEGKYLKVDSI